MDPSFPVSVMPSMAGAEVGYLFVIQTEPPLPVEVTYFFFDNVTEAMQAYNLTEINKIKLLGQCPDGDHPLGDHVLLHIVPAFPGKDFVLVNAAIRGLPLVPYGNGTEKGD